ncbi:hypothetical protein [Uruburuella testudinis]|nr:hypothetical protein [Uruburuella testudinis]
MFSDGLLVGAVLSAGMGMMCFLGEARAAILLTITARSEDK